MPLTLTFMIPSMRSVKTRAVVDPAQYDTEINTPRGFAKPNASKSKKIDSYHTSSKWYRVRPRPV